MKIDCFTHIMPQRYYQALKARMTGPDYLSGLIEQMPELVDMDARERVMDRHGIDRQVLTISSPPIEVALDDPDASAELTRIANDEIAEVCAARPRRFIPVGSVAMNHPEEMAREAERCVTELGMKGVLIYSSGRGKPLDAPDYADFFAAMAQQDYPIWLHPARGGNQADYPGEPGSKYWIWQVFGWPYETTAAMTRLVFAGIFDRHPELKIITHHAGAMVPFFEKRIEYIYDTPGLPELREAAERLQRKPSDYFRMFYNDTALMGAVGGMAAAYSYFGADRLLFGTDTPFDGRGGDGFTPDTVHSIEALLASPEDKQKIFAGNALRLLRLDA